MIPTDHSTLRDLFGNTCLLKENKVTKILNIKFIENAMNKM